MAVVDLQHEPMMAHLMASLDQGQDIGHYGRLVFIMVGRHFMGEDEMIAYLTKDQDMDEEKARALISQVEARGYNPPKRERVLEWMSKQEFPICPDTSDPGQCNVYKNLEFPKEIYDKIQSYYEGKS